MIELSDQNMATNPQCYKDREDYSIDVVLPFSVDLTQLKDKSVV